MREHARRPRHAPAAPARAARAPAVPPVVYDVLREPGVPLGAGERAFFEPRFGADFADVRVHTGPTANAATRSLDAAAFTVGKQIVMGPRAGSGSRLLAHELTHVVQQNHAPLPNRALEIGPADSPLEREARHAAAAAAGRAADVAGRTSPLVQRAPDSEIEVDNEPQSADEVERAERAGAKMPPTTRRAVYPEGDDGVALKELVEKWRGFVVAAARDTGPNGVTARVVACVLMEEIKGTPHFFESAESRRKTEAEDANEAVQKARAGKKVDPKELNKSMGVGQVKPSTAAAVLDQIPLIEQDRANRAPGRAAAEEKYQNLTVEQKAKLIEMLAQPKSNIEIAAKLLAKLKNRPNRFPDLSREKFGANERAVSIIATEYNLGATTTPEFRAEASDYGKRVWNNMSGDLMYWFFPNI